MHTRIWLMGILLSGSLALAAAAQTAGRAGAPQPAAAPSALPVNLETALDKEITLDLKGVPFDDAIETIRKATRTNIAVNWNALEAAGVKHETPVTLYVHGVTYEAAVKALMELLPAANGGANYTVGDNILEITTNAEIGKAPVLRVRSIDRVLGYSLGAAAAAGGERDQNARLLERVLTAELRRAGEPMDARHALAIRGNSLAATVSDRGLAVVDRALTALNQPAKPGQYASGTQLTASVKGCQPKLGP